MEFDSHVNSRDMRMNEGRRRECKRRNLTHMESKTSQESSLTHLKYKLYNLWCVSLLAFSDMTLYNDDIDTL